MDKRRGVREWIRDINKQGHQSSIGEVILTVIPVNGFFVGLCFNQQFCDLLFVSNDGAV